jgi:DNA-binding response OmpR family regulator
LVVEDDAVLQRVMQRSLEESGHRVDVAAAAAQARYLWRVQSYDAVLLDLNLPDGDGVEVLRDARARGDRTPVLILTAHNRTEERIAGLDAGADDYLGKPFDIGEVEARLRALERRSRDTDSSCVVGGLVLDRKEGRFYKHAAKGVGAAPGGPGASPQPFDLPAREQAVLVELMTPPGRVVSKRVLSNTLSDLDDSLGDNALEAFISRLRKKLVGTGASIRTLRGLGYLVEPAAADESS